jgi:hypothetical protein
LNDKHQRLVQSKRARLILVGGSNMAFGIQSELIEAALPYEPTNLGLHAGLGLGFILEDALSEVAHDDIVVVSLEYRLMKQKSTSPELWEGLLLRPKALIGLNWAQISDAGFGFVSHVGNRGLRIMAGKDRRNSSDVYSRKSFNKYGDVVMHRLLPPVRPFIAGDPGDTTPLGCASEELLPVLQNFIRSCEARGARVFIFFPPIPEQLFESHRAELEAHVARQNSLFGTRVLGRLEDIPFPESEFYDTSYHLTGPGAAHRTKLMIERLGAISEPATQTIASR